MKRQFRYLVGLFIMMAGFVSVAKSSVALLIHDYAEGADNSYFIYKHVKKRKQDVEDFHVAFLAANGTSSEAYVRKKPHSPVPAPASFFRQWIYRPVLDTSSQLVRFLSGRTMCLLGCRLTI
ncbi:hypothetical protein [Filimonas effusa]|uniref:Uncharacterized protein n=1 Tax=Filimonas effusa TaxID=2508721 RepID=A0A4Q1D7T1_9BACT|nr:hypothetical protein [Filimonas effusa]RXK83767.1 hypothetical protein ESB13_16980 [Filimonas effusa]